MYDTILVATDGSGGATHAVEHAIDMAGAYGATLHVLCVVDVRHLESAPHRDRMVAAARRILETIRERAERERVTVTTAIRSGIPYEEVLAYVTETGVDLVVVGSHRSGGIGPLLLDSTTDRVLRLADAPVMVVPPLETDSGTRSSTGDATEDTRQS